MTKGSIEYKLKKPFPVNKVHWRNGKNGMKLAYIDARDVQHRLDEVFGVMGWQCEYSVQGNSYCCSISAWDDEKCMFITKSNGAGQTNFEGEKGGYSDAFKRAAVLFGIGRYLYSVKGSTLPPWATPEGFDKLVEDGKI